VCEIETCRGEICFRRFGGIYRLQLEREPPKWPFPIYIAHYTVGGSNLGCHSPRRGLSSASTRRQILKWFMWSQLINILEKNKQKLCLQPEGNIPSVIWMCITLRYKITCHSIKLLIEIIRVNTSIWFTRSFHTIRHYIWSEIYNVDNWKWAWEGEPCTLYIGCFKKSFTTLKEYTNLYRGHTQRFEMS
jgi:hypothetical protein